MLGPERRGKVDGAPPARGNDDAGTGPRQARRRRPRVDHGADRARRSRSCRRRRRIAFDFTVLEIVLMGRSPRLGLLGIEGEKDLAEIARRALEFTDTEALAERPHVAPVLRRAPESAPRARAGPGAGDDRARRADGLPRSRPPGPHPPTARRASTRSAATTVVFVSHDLNLAARYSARVASSFATGGPSADGPPSGSSPRSPCAPPSASKRASSRPVLDAPTVFVLRPHDCSKRRDLLTDQGRGPDGQSPTRSRPSRRPNLELSVATDAGVHPCSPPPETVRLHEGTGHGLPFNGGLNTRGRSRRPA